MFIAGIFDWTGSLVDDVMDVFKAIFNLENLATLFVEVLATITDLLSKLLPESIGTFVDGAFSVYLLPTISAGFCFGAYYGDWFIPWGYLSATIPFLMILVGVATAVRGAIWIYVKIWGST